MQIQNQNSSKRSLVIFESPKSFTMQYLFVPAYLPPIYCCEIANLVPLFSGYLWSKVEDSCKQRRKFAWRVSIIIWRRQTIMIQCVPYKKMQNEFLSFFKHTVHLGTGYSFWDRLCNFLHKFTWIVLTVHKLNKLGKFW